MKEKIKFKHNALSNERRQITLNLLKITSASKQYRYEIKSIQKSKLIINS